MRSTSTNYAPRLYNLTGYLIACNMVKVLIYTSISFSKTENTTSITKGIADEQVGYESNNLIHLTTINTDSNIF